MADPEAAQELIPSRRRAAPALLLVLSLVAPGVFAPEAVAAPPVGPGISRALAAWRAPRYRDVRYSLDLEVDRDAARLAGTVQIELTLASPPPDVVLDWRPAAGTRLEDLRVDGAPAAAARVVRDHIVVPARLLHPGRNTVRARIEAPIAVAGGALTRYEDHEDGSRYVYTLFVPADASTVFPCFDQPDLKGRFRLELAAPASWTVIGNGPARDVEDRGATKRWRFEETPPISTYLFAFAAGPFVEAGNGTDLRTRLFVRRSRAERASREAGDVLEQNARALDWLAEYFDRPFPFAKYDLVLVPEFAYGGMEHAGAGFLREESVLFPSEPNENDRLRRAQLLFHEATHQWFGDLVTMKWFDDLWLKEGFANFMAAKATEALLPKDPAWTAFHALKVTAYRTDVTRGTTPIFQPLANLAAAKSAYGTIVYGKAPAVLRQAEFYVGEAAFRAAVRAFVAAHAYGSADWSDLVHMLERASRKDLRAWAAAWVQRRGMPRVRLAWSTDASGAVRGATLRQSDVLREGGVWPMRVRLAAVAPDGSARGFDATLRGRRAPLPALDGIPAPALLFANDGDYGYGQFLLDAKSRATVLARPDLARDALLRSLVFDAVWDSVREAELAPREYIDFALRAAPAERDPVTLSTLLARVEAAFRVYLSDAQRDAVAPALERTLVNGMLGADSAGRRISFFRAFADSAWSPEGRAVIKRLLARALEVPGVPLSSRDRFRLVARLLVLGDPDGETLLAAQAEADPGDDGRRYAYAAGAARRDAAVKSRYFERALRDAALPESWVEAALGAQNAPEHAALTAALVEPALRALPELKRSRKIFFVNEWLSAFLGGQRDAEVLAVVRRFLQRPELDRDLRLKVLEAVDPLERAVRIRAKFAAG
ncbi:MAG TPA: M1 family aminopeptidase [Burkholderiales bacterium]